MVRVIGPREPHDSEAINTTSTAKGWSKGLSPFYLGPVDCYDNLTARNVENGWQFSKVYSEHVNELGEILSSYFEWRDKGWSSQRAERYPMGKGRKPLFSLWNGKKYTYIEARRHVYIPLYAKAVVKSAAFKQLREQYDIFGEITLWDFDGYDHRRLNMSYEDVITCETRKCGHGFVLAMLLENYLKV